MGFALQVIFPIRTGQPIGLFDPQYPVPPTVPNPQNVIEATRTTGCDAILAVPTFVEVRTIFAFQQSTIRSDNITEVGSV